MWRRSETPILKRARIPRENFVALSNPFASALGSPIGVASAISGAQSAMNPTFVPTTGRPDAAASSTATGAASSSDITAHHHRSPCNGRGSAEPSAGVAARAFVKDSSFNWALSRMAWTRSVCPWVAALTRALSVPSAPASTRTLMIRPATFDWLTSRHQVWRFDWNDLPVIIGLLAALTLAAVAVVARRAQRRRRAVGFALASAAVLGLAVGVAPGWRPLPFPELHGFNLAFIGIIIAAVWQMAGYTMALYLAGLTGIPEELREAAVVEGANDWQLYTRIILPLMVPGLTVVFVFTFVLQWGNFFVPFILLQAPESQPASVTIYTFFAQYGQVAYGQLAAFSILYTAPVVLLYSALSRVFSGAFSLTGAVKG